MIVYHSFVESKRDRNFIAIIFDGVGERFVHVSSFVAHIRMIYRLFGLVLPIFILLEPSTGIKRTGESCNPRDAVSRDSAMGSDLIRTPFYGCQYYVGDTLSRNSYRSDNLRRMTDRTGNIFPTKLRARPAILNNAMGFVDRFQAFLDQFIVNKLLAPLLVLTADPASSDSLMTKINQVSADNTELRAFLDSKDLDMVAAVTSAWEADKETIRRAAQNAGTVLRRSETAGVQQVNQEMRSMYTLANRVARDNDRDISRLARAEILQANSSARAVGTSARQLWQTANNTLTRANTLFGSMNDTAAILAAAQSQATLLLSQALAEVNAAASAKFVQAQNSSNADQLRAGSTVDNTLTKVGQDVARALQSLADEENRNVTAVTSNNERLLQALERIIGQNVADANRRAVALSDEYNRNITSVMGSATDVFGMSDRAVADATNKVNTANGTLDTLRTSMATQFAGLSNAVSAAYNNQTQQAALARANLEAWMDTTLNMFKQYALNTTRSGSAQLKDAYDAAISTVTTGAGSLSLSFEQRQKLVAALSNWQKDYKGNTDKLVGAFTSTYSGLVADTSSELNNAVTQQKAQIDAANAANAKMLQDAIAAAGSDPTKLNAVLAKFGIVGDRAAAAAKQIQTELIAASSGIQNGVTTGLTALELIQNASSATSAAYAQAAALNAQASVTSQAAVANVTQRIGTMNAVLQQYSTQLSNQLFSSQSAAQSEVEQAATANGQQVSADVEAKMTQVQALLAEVLAKGQNSTAELNTFAARVGANATVLRQMVDALQSGNTDELAKITTAKKEALAAIQAQVTSQLSANAASFTQQADAEKQSLARLLEGMRSDLSSQTGAKSALLVSHRDQLQQLYGEMSASSIQRDRTGSDLDSKLSSAEASAATQLADLATQIGAQKSRVRTAFVDKRAMLDSASSSVQATVADTNATAAAALGELQAQSAARVQGVKKGLEDSTYAVEMMVNRYEDTMAKYLDQDRDQRVKENAAELTSLLSVKQNLAASAEDQRAAQLAKETESKNRANQLASMVASLNGASAAAAAGEPAFREYVRALAEQTNTSMIYLVEAMRSTLANNKSELYSLLSANGMFVQSTLQDLTTDALLLQDGAVAGGGEVLDSLDSSRVKSSATASTATAAFATAQSDTKGMQSITGEQLVQLMTMFLGQSALQDDSIYQANQEAFGKIADLDVALNTSLAAMDAVSESTQDVLELANSRAQDAQTEIDFNTSSVVAVATGKAADMLDESKTEYDALKKALDEALSFNGVFKNKLDSMQETWDRSKPAVEGDLTKIKSDITNLGKTLSDNNENAMERINNWATSMESDALNQLTAMQAV